MVYSIYKQYLHEGKVIYVHPKHYRMFYRSTIPLSLPALIHRIPYKVRGYFHEDLNTEIIRTAEIVIIDVHWNYALKGAHDLILILKEINPSIVIITGGLTASMYPEILVNKFDIDYVIRGDAEFSLPELVQSIIEKQDNIDKIPNLIGKNGLKTNWSYVLTQTDLDQNEFYDLSFFPNYEADINKIHNRYYGWPFYTYPYLLPFRGCNIDCESCSGSISEQKKLFQRGPVIRSAERLSEDLSILNNNPAINYVNVVYDFLSLLPEKYTQQALSRVSNLEILYEFTRAPEPESLDFLLSRFKGGILYFSLDDMHTQSSRFTEPSEMISLINLVKKSRKYIPVLYYNKSYFNTNGYKDALKDIATATKCLCSDVSDWWEDFPRPDEHGIAASESFDKFYKYSVKPEVSVFLKTIRKIWFNIFVIGVRFISKKMLLKMKLIYMKTLQPYHK